MRSRRNVLPGSLLFATFGALGQAAYNFADSREGSTAKDGADDGKGKGKGGWLNSKWSPVKALSDEEYGRILEERLLRLNAEIAVLDESIEGVKRGASGTTTPATAATTKTEGKK